MYFIGVDLGTSAVKLLLMDDTGKICGSVSREYPLYFPQPGWSEQKPEDWWSAVCDGLKELLGGIDVEFPSGKAENGLLGRADAAFQHVSE